MSEEVPPSVPAEPVQIPADAAIATADNAAVPDEEFSLDPMLLMAIGLLLLSVLVFLRTLNVQTTWLDDFSLTDNPYVQAVDGISHFWSSADRSGRFEPMTLTSYWLSFRIFRDNIAGTHLVNMLLHGGVVVLLWTLLRRLEVRGALFAAALFAVHPVHAQAVAWISGRGVVLASAFYLASMLVYLRYLGVTVAPDSKTMLTLPPEPERLWGLAFILFIGAMLSNAATAVTFPIAVLLLLWWKRSGPSAKEWLGLLPFFIVAIGVGIWTGYLQAISLPTKALTTALGSTSIVDRLLIAPRATCFYAWKIVAPVPLIFDYPRWSASVALAAVCAIAVIALLVMLWSLRTRFGRGPFVAGLLFVITLLPALSLLDAPALRYSFAADYRQYLASAALIILIATALAQLASSDRLLKLVNPSYAGAVVVLLFAALTFHQDGVYATDKNLWYDTVALNPSTLLGHQRLGDALLSSGQFEAAQASYEVAESIAPNDPRVAVAMGNVAAAKGYDDAAYGHAELVTQQQTTAESYYRKAIALDPDFEPAYVALSTLDSWKKDDNGMIDALTKAVSLEREAFRPRLELGAALRRANRLPEAEKVLTELVDDAPTSSQAHSELGTVYIQEQNPQGAVSEWQRAIELDPTNISVHLNFGALLDNSGQPELAAQQFLAATIVDPNSVLARLDLAHLDTKLGRRHDAVMQLTRAVELDPSNVAIQTALAKAIEQEKMLGPGTMPSTLPTLGPTIMGDVMGPGVTTAPTR